MLFARSLSFDLADTFRYASGPTPSISGTAGELHRSARVMPRHDATRSRPRLRGRASGATESWRWVAWPIPALLLLLIFQTNFLSG